jgi:hypothetical protein
MVAFEIRRFEIFCKIGLYQIVGIHDNDLGWKWAVLTDAAVSTHFNVATCVCSSVY